MDVAALERSLKAVASRRRIVMLAYLKKEGSANVSEIAHEARISVKAASKHLLRLASLGIVDREQCGMQASYHLRSEQGKILRFVLSLL